MRYKTNELGRKRVLADVERNCGRGNFGWNVVEGIWRGDVVEGFVCVKRCRGFVTVLAGGRRKRAPREGGTGGGLRGLDWREAKIKRGPGLLTVAWKRRVEERVGLSSSKMSQPRHA